MSVVLRCSKLNAAYRRSFYSRLSFSDTFSNNLVTAAFNFLVSDVEICTTDKVLVVLAFFDDSNGLCLMSLKQCL